MRMVNGRVFRNPLKKALVCLLALLSSVFCTVGCSVQSSNTAQLRNTGITNKKDILISAKKISGTVYSLEYWSRKTKVQAYANVPDSNDPLALVVYLHGGYTLPGNLHSTNNEWTEQNAAAFGWQSAISLLPNYAGYGPSSGYVGSPYDDLVDAKNAITALKEMGSFNLSGGTYIFGSSLGGDIAMMLASAEPDVQAVALDSPFPGAATFVNWDEHYGQSALNNSDAMDFLDAYGDNTSSRLYQLNSFNYSKISVPVLIVGGKSDPTVPPSLLRYMYKKLKRHDHHVVLKFVSGGHVPDTQTEHTLVVQWFIDCGLAM